MDRRQKSISSFPRIWIIIAVAAGLLIMGDLNRRMGDARRLDRDAETLQTEVASLESQAESLSTQLALATGEVLVENWARSEARMIRPGEHLIIPKPDPGAEIAPTPQPFIEEKPLSPFEIWLALLIG